MTDKHPLTAWRETKGKTQAEMAEALGVTRWTITSIETRRREPSPKLARAIEAKTGIPLQQLWRAA